MKTSWFYWLNWLGVCAGAKKHPYTIWQMLVLHPYIVKFYTHTPKIRSLLYSCKITQRYAVLYYPITRRANSTEANVPALQGKARTRQGTIPFQKPRNPLTFQMVLVVSQIFPLYTEFLPNPSL